MPRKPLTNEGVADRHARQPSTDIQAARGTGREAAITEYVRPRLLARHQDLAVEDDDRAVAAACDALYEQLLGGGEDLTGGCVELRAGVDDAHVLVAVAVVRFE